MVLPFLEEFYLFVKHYIYKWKGSENKGKPEEAIASEVEGQLE